MTEPVERRLSALVSADVAGYSKMIATDEVGTVRTLTAYREEMGVLARQHKGRVVDAPGDNILMEFPSATDAVEAAIEIQRVLSARNELLPDQKRLAFRMGVHLGEVLVEGDRIYGDGVNVAARIEAEAEPGGIAVSEAIRAQVVSKVDARFDDLGEYELKNIENPVRVHALVTRKAASPIQAEKSVVDSRAAWIAVLPFDNMSGDPAQDYFADGLTEDIITGLSAFRRLRVVSRTASFQYRGSDRPVPDIARDLGVRFVVEGSVRRAGDRVRVTAQLIDTIDLHHIWADRYDEDIDDMFEAQDRITESIVSAIDPAITTSESERLARVRPENIDVWGHVVRGWGEFYSYKPEANKAAQSHFRAAIELDPDHAEAHSGLATSLTFDAFLFWVDDIEGTMKLAHDEARRAVELDRRDAMGYAILGFISARLGRLDTAVQQADRAVELNPNNHIAQIMDAAAKTYNGDLEGGLANTEKALALAPTDPSANWFWGNKALALLLLGRAEEAAAAGREAIKIRHGYLFGRSVLAAALIDLDRVDEAKTEVDRILEIDPAWNASRFDDYHFRFHEHRDHLIDNLLAAGMPG